MPRWTGRIGCACPWRGHLCQAGLTLSLMRAMGCRVHVLYFLALLHQYRPYRPQAADTTCSTQRSQVRPGGSLYRQVYSSPITPAITLLSYCAPGTGPPLTGVQL